jgi:hypothetical protein
VQLATHLPFEHTWLPPHATPQAPQLAGSFRGFVQTPPHAVWPCWQTHPPLLHVVPPVQVLPHAPQLFESLATATQAPLQS